MLIKNDCKDKMNNAEKVFNLFRAILGGENEVDRDKEHFWILGVNTKLRIKYIELVSLGILDKVVVHPREVFRMAVMQGVSSIILVHNHPGGDPEPSEDDKRLTKALNDSGKIIDINILDHVIIGDSFFSFREERLILEGNHV
ncbi:MAG TPA: JAB domain-containing protein [Thermodesulfobacteriota bacterium]|nr:JAB domain-containing protein [Thermodesulfobacteriota bacterium]